MNKYLYIAILLFAMQIHSAPSITFIYDDICGVTKGSGSCSLGWQPWIILQNNEQKELLCGGHVTIPMNPEERISLLSPIYTFKRYYKLDITLASTNSESNQKPAEAHILFFNPLISAATNKGVTNHSVALDEHTSLEIRVHSSIFTLNDNELVEIKIDRQLVDK